MQEQRAFLWFENDKENVSFDVCIEHSEWWFWLWIFGFFHSPFNHTSNNATKKNGSIFIVLHLKFAIVFLFVFKQLKFNPCIKTAEETARNISCLMFFRGSGCEKQTRYYRAAVWLFFPHRICCRLFHDDAKITKTWSLFYARHWCDTNRSCRQEKCDVYFPG